MRDTHHFGIVNPGILADTCTPTVSHNFRAYIQAGLDTHGTLVLTIPIDNDTHSGTRSSHGFDDSPIDRLLGFICYKLIR